MMVVEQVLQHHAHFAVLVESPSESSVDARVTGYAISWERRDVVKKCIEVKIARQIEERVKLKLMAWTLSFGAFGGGIPACWITMQLHSQERISSVQFPVVCDVPICRGLEAIRFTAHQIPEPQR